MCLSLLLILLRPKIPKIADNYDSPNRLLILIMRIHSTLQIRQTVCEFNQQLPSKSFAPLTPTHICLFVINRTISRFKLVEHTTTTCPWSQRFIPQPLVSGDRARALQSGQSPNVYLPIGRLATATTTNTNVELYIYLQGKLRVHRPSHTNSCPEDLLSLYLYRSNI